MELLHDGVEKFGFGLFSVIVGVLALLPITLTVLYGVFAFSNPD